MASRKQVIASLGVMLVLLLCVVFVISIRSTQMRFSAQFAEAPLVLVNVRVAQESYFAEVGNYANISSSLDERMCPINAVSRERVPWNPGCNGGVAMWGVMPLHFDEPVLFRYTVVAGGRDDPLPRAPLGYRDRDHVLAEHPGAPWFVAFARGDGDGDGAHDLAMLPSWGDRISFQAGRE